MPPISQALTTNFLLQRMLPEDFALLAGDMVRVVLPQSTVIHVPGDPLDTIHFFECGIASVIVAGSNGWQAEVGQVGREGLHGRAAIVEFGEVGIRVEMCIAGSSLSLPVKSFEKAMEQSRTLRPFLTRYVQCFDIQVIQTLLSTARYTIHQRVSRWLLMCQDRVGNRLLVTHAQMAVILSIRRASVTNELQILDGLRALRSTRGEIVIKDRAMLLEMAAGSYGIPEEAYERLIPVRGAAEVES